MAQGKKGKYKFCTFKKYYFPLSTLKASQQFCLWNSKKCYNCCHAGGMHDWIDRKCLETIRWPGKQKQKQKQSFVLRNLKPGYE